MAKRAKKSSKKRSKKRAKKNGGASLVSLTKRVTTLEKVVHKSGLKEHYGT